MVRSFRPDDVLTANVLPSRMTSLVSLCGRWQTSSGARGNVDAHNVDLGHHEVAHNIDLRREQGSLLISKLVFFISGYFQKFSFYK